MALAFARSRGPGRAQNPPDAAMIAPRPFATGLASLPPRYLGLRLAINAAQIAQILRRALELTDHAHQRILQLRGFGELLPFKRTAQQPDAIFIRRFGGFQTLTD